MQKPKKELGYYGVAVGSISFGLFLFDAMSDALKSNWGTAWYVSFVILVALVVVYFSKDSI